MRSSDHRVLSPSGREAMRMENTGLFKSVLLQPVGILEEIKMSLRVVVERPMWVDLFIAVNSVVRA